MRRFKGDVRQYGEGFDGFRKFEAHHVQRQLYHQISIRIIQHRRVVCLPIHLNNVLELKDAFGIMPLKPYIVDGFPRHPSLLLFRRHLGEALFLGVELLRFGGRRRPPFRILLRFRRRLNVARLLKVLPLQRSGGGGESAWRRNGDERGTETRDAELGKGVEMRGVEMRSKYGRRGKLRRRDDFVRTPIKRVETWKV